MRLTSNNILHEPLLHFVVLAAVLFIAGHYWGEGDSARYRINVTSEELQRIGEGYYRQYGAVPTPEQLRHLVDRYVHDEILYREGLAMGLDREDEIIRRRIVQKIGFLEQDVSVVGHPTLSQLASYYRQHEQRYRLPSRRSFTEIYFSPDHGGDAQARARALSVLSEVLSSSSHVTRSPGRGDAFPGPADYTSVGAVEVARVFGESEFSTALFAAPVGKWSGPYRSGYGWHLLYVQSAEPPRTPLLAEILDAVRSDYTAEIRAQMNAEAFAKLSAKYTVVRPSVSSTLTALPATSAATRTAGTD